VGLVFFCGRHLAWDENQGGLAMIRSLIVQVLRQFPLTVVQSYPDMSLQGFESDDVNILCKIFFLLVQQLPSIALIFCLIDGINLYETEEYLDGIEIVVLHLVDLVEQGICVRRSSFKLLITCPQPTLEVRKAFDSEPDILFHMQNLPVTGEGVNIASVQEQLTLNMTLRPE
jgi:hypothetical protein